MTTEGNPSHKYSSQDTSKQQTSIIRLLLILVFWLLGYLVTIVSTPRGVSSPAPLMACLVGMTSWVGRTGILFTPTLKKVERSSSSIDKDSFAAVTFLNAKFCTTKDKLSGLQHEFLTYLQNIGTTRIKAHF